VDFPQVILPSETACTHWTSPRTSGWRADWEAVILLPQHWAPELPAERGNQFLQEAIQAEIMFRYPKPAPMLVYQTARANNYQNEIRIMQNYCLKQNQACSPIQTHLSVFSRKKKKHTQHLLNYSDFFLLLSLLVQAKALKSHEAHWSCAISHLILKHLKLMGKVILITSLPEQIWSAQMNIQALQSPAYHTLLFPLGQILPGYTEPPGWHSLKDTKCPLKGDKDKIECNQEELQLDCYRGSCHNL